MPAGNGLARFGQRVRLGGTSALRCNGALYLFLNESLRREWPSSATSACFDIHARGKLRVFAFDLQRRVFAGADAPQTGIEILVSFDGLVIDPGDDVADSQARL